MNCAHVLLRIMPTVVGGTEVKVPKARSYPKGKPKGDNSMTLKVWFGSDLHASRSGSYAVYG